MESLQEILNRSQLANVNSKVKPSKQLPLAQVDELADKLVKDYANPEFRGWYCGVINKFGVAKVYEWQRRAETGEHPGRLFTIYVNQAGGYRRSDAG